MPSSAAEIVGSTGPDHHRQLAHSGRLDVAVALVPDQVRGAGGVLGCGVRVVVPPGEDGEHTMRQGEVEVAGIGDVEDLLGGAAGRGRVDVLERVGQRAGRAGAGGTGCRSRGPGASARRALSIAASSSPAASR